MSDDVAGRMRGLADAPWVARGDAATQAALREGAAEVDRLTRALDAAEAQARGAQYREREARNEAAMLRARLDGAQGVAEVQRACAVMQAAIATIALDRWRRADAEIAALRAQAQPDAGDLAGLGARAVR